MIEGYKGFRQGMWCLDRQYSENAVFEEPGDPVPCEHGIHFCESPFDVLTHYGFVAADCQLNEFATVQAEACDCKRGNNKMVTSKLRIGKKLDISGFCREILKFLLEKASAVGVVQRNTSDVQSSEGNYKTQAQVGNYSHQEQLGDYSCQAQDTIDGQQTQVGYMCRQAQSGHSCRQSQIGTDCIQVQEGVWGRQTQAGSICQQAQTVGSSRQAQLGDECRQVQLAGKCDQTQSGIHCIQAQAGDLSRQAQLGNTCRQAQYGLKSRQVALGDDCEASASGEKSLVAVLGNRGCVRGALGCVLVLAEYRSDGSKEPYIYRVVSARVDGEHIKPNTWYFLHNGEFQEA